MSSDRRVKHNWPSQLTLKCFPEIKERGQRIWVNKYSGHYFSKNISATWNLTDVDNYDTFEPPYCQFYVDGKSCLIDTNDWIHRSEIKLLIQNNSIINAFLNQYLVLRLFEVLPEDLPFISDREDQMTECNLPTAFFEAETLYIPKVSGEKIIKCVIYGMRLVYNIKYDISTKNHEVHREQSEILYPVKNTKIYNYNHNFYNGLKTTKQKFSFSCLNNRLSNGDIIYRLKNNEITNLNSALLSSKGLYELYCEIINKPYSRVSFSIISPLPPKILSGLKNCKIVGNICEFNLSVNHGRYVDELKISWYFNGVRLTQNKHVKINESGLNMVINISDYKSGNVQAIISNRFGSQMASAYAEYVEPPYFEVDLPESVILKDKTTTIDAKVYYDGVERVSMWWAINGDILNKSNKPSNVISSVNTKGRTCTLKIEKDTKITMDDVFSCFFKAGPLVIESRQSKITTFEKSNSSYLYGIGGGVVVLIIVLVIIKFVWRRYAGTYCVESKEREYGLIKNTESLSAYNENKNTESLSAYNENKNTESLSAYNENKNTESLSAYNENKNTESLSAYNENKTTESLSAYNENKSTESLSAYNENKNTDSLSAYNENSK